MRVFYKPRTGLDVLLTVSSGNCPRTIRVTVNKRLADDREIAFNGTTMDDNSTGRLPPTSSRVTDEAQARATNEILILVWVIPMVPLAAYRR